MRDKVGEALFPTLLTPPVKHIACDGGGDPQDVVAGRDGTLLESVLMRYPDRATLCISSQAGCGMACPFCATGQGGLNRNLSTAEIVDQVRAAAAALRDGDVAGGPGRLSNVVFMGMGGAARELQAGRRRGASDHVSGTGGPRVVPAVGDRVDGRAGPPGDPPAGGRGSARHTRRVAPHSRRRTARHVGPPSTTAGRSRRCSTRPATTRTRPVAASRSSTR